MPPENTGNFGQSIGGSQALVNAMQRRGIDASVLDQVSPAAPTGPSPVSGTEPTNNVLSQTPAATQQGQQEAQSQFRSAEQEIALKALSDTVKTENKIAETILGLR